MSRTDIGRSLSEAEEAETSSLDHVTYLAGEIGPRGTGSMGESRAADYVADQLSRMEIQVERQHFRAVNSQNAFAVAIDMVALLAIVVYPIGGLISRIISTALGLAAPVLLWQTIRMSNNPLRFFLPSVRRHIHYQVSSWRLRNRFHLRQEFQRKRLHSGECLQRKYSRGAFLNHRSFHTPYKAGIRRYRLFQIFPH